MFKIYDCITATHDVKLVVLAAAICAMASYAAISLLHHARRSIGHLRNVWLAVSAVSTGFGIWATHFIAMLAFNAGLPSGYNITLTFLSLIAALVLTGAGLSVAVIWNGLAVTALGGAIIAGGIGVMHYIGMAAYQFEGTIQWNTNIVAVSILTGAMFGAIALPVGLHQPLEKWKIGGAFLLLLAICSLHFTGMSAVSVLPDPTIAISESAISSSWLAASVALVSIVIIALALAGIVFDIRDKRRSELELDHMRDLANASVEGLIVCDGDEIVSVNTSFARLLNLTPADMVGARLSACFPNDKARSNLLSGTSQELETELQVNGAQARPVELIMRPIIYSGRPHHVIAVRDLKERKDAQKHIQFLAHHDTLTALPNRAQFNERVDLEIAKLEEGQTLAVLYLDLDRFKEVNDLFGHAAGDKVLQTVASRATMVLGSRGLMARLGGDEFAILLPNIAGPSGAERIAELVLAALRATSEEPEINSISTSIGIALCPDDAIDRQALLSHADTALYKAKSDGRNTFRFFEAKMGEEIRKRRVLERDLRHAVSRNEFRLVYQPQKAMGSSDVAGFEALLRWQHPTRGEIPPSVFIPIAEECGAILEIGEWVLRTACIEASSWERPLTIAVNVSAAQLYNPGFVQEVHQTLIDTGLPSKRLELEITETALIRDFNRALTTLRLIKALGIKIAMDDFGTGYSSLSNLRAFPFDKIKIDRSFIKSVDVNKQAATIVRAVLGIGRGLGLPVLAEGVETNAEMSFLRDEACDEIQGYLIGRPNEINHFREYTHHDLDRPLRDPVRPSKLIRARLNAG
jgi:diguanylate cyclase (GGDEF)-like protein/PAS domain S-box-containing protein